MKRKLGAHEHLMWLLELMAPYNIQAVVKFSGQLNEQVMRRALLMMQQQHPYLRVQLAYDDVVSFVPCDHKIDCEVVERKSSRDWKSVAEREIAISTVVRNKPMFRLVWLRGKRAHELVFTLNHLIIAGITLAHFVRDFLEICSLLMLGGKPALHNYPERLPAEAMFLGSGNVDADVVKKIASDRLKHKKSTRYISHKLSVEMTERVRSQAKKHGCSLQGVMCAVFMLARYEIESSANLGKQLVNSFTPVNMRPHMPMEIAPEELSNYISALPASAEIDEHSSVWDLAKNIKQQLNSAFENNDHVNHVLGWRENIQTINTPEKVFELFKEMQEQLSIPVSNLGVVDLPSKVGEFVIKDLFVGANLPLLWQSYLAVVYTLHGQLVFNLGYVYPDIAKREAERYLSVVMRILDEVGHS